ncbi:acyl-CoA dehydrogenase family protein [Candidatus Uabimicrobium amorphum]|uniref:Acyl-CoA dehydrogenase n=1 Tax=Uabimicrobium amorphum TaxID=2596890 RepID=A0A5S9ISJ6_UABAM|nr:acyl-CoA dehydrogenase family protein [Candidatus Uabimicrobium amorphum]BBM86957.1 acyl-CoA dehydrogenase [Candidatus Uabimicrobium amorphum]
MNKVIENEKQNLASEEEARNVAEAAREKKWTKGTFLREIFLGKLRLNLVEEAIAAMKEPSKEFSEFYDKMRDLLEKDIDSDAIDRNEKVPQEVLDKLAELGAFGMKIKKEFGGLGFSQTEYNAVLELVGSQDSNLGALLSAHQSIGVPQPLQLFGTKEQKEKYLPQIAKGKVTAFALTESYVGSDPANLTTSVKEVDDNYILNGEKLWCTNGTIADYIVVMARHEGEKALSAFVVDMDWEGVKVEHRCQFMGLRGIENGVISFKDVKIPKGNLLWKKGAGLKLALITLNTGRLSVPAICTGVAKTCLKISRRWGNERFQWGQPIGKHEIIGHKIASMAANTFAMEAVSKVSTAMMEQGYDVRLESSVAKMYNTEMGWGIVDDTMQIRGGRGYETTESLEARKESPWPVERMMRDYRINLVFEGSSEVMRLFIAREAVDKHLSVAGSFIDKKVSIGNKILALPKIGLFYAWWYPTRWLGWSMWPKYSRYGKLAKHMRYIERTTRKLSRAIFHGMMIHQAKLEKKQAFLFRIVEMGAELFAMSATVAYAQKQEDKNAQNLADAFCNQAKQRIKSNFKALWSNDDDQRYKLAREILDENYTWLEKTTTKLNDKNESES